MDFKKPSKEFTEQFNHLVSKSNSIVITAHYSPDDDSVASVLAMYSFLKEQWPKKKVVILYTGDNPKKLISFKNYDKICFVEDLAEEMKTVDLFVGLDGSQFTRFTKLPELFTTSFKGKSICIDHHSSPIDHFDLSLVDTGAASTTELIYLSFYKDAALSKQLAETFLLGILGDTGTFNYIKPNQLEVFDIVKKLLQISGVEIQEFKSRYNTISQRIFHLIQEIMRNSQFLTVKGWPNVMVTHLSRDFKDSGTYDDSEISEAAHAFMGDYLRVITDYPWGFIVTPRANGDCSVSMRSLPKSVNVRSIAERMKIGGGHDRAGGGTFKSNGMPVNPKECIEKILSWMKENLCELS